MKNKNRTVQAVEETLIVILLAAVVILAVQLYKTKAAMEEMVMKQEAAEELAATVPEVLPEPEAEPENTPEPEEAVSSNETESESTSGNSAETASGNSTASTVKWIENYPQTTVDMPLAERMRTHSSYDDTMEINAYDKSVIANSTVDFSGMKIACLGDSLTSASNLSDSSRGYTDALKEILGAEEVYNLGIGGSTVMRGSRGANPMVDRFGQIPDDTDIILIFASTNDCLFENQWEFGHIEYEKRMASGTFCGDLDEMLGGIKYSYIEHGDKYVKLLFAAPPATVLNTEARKDAPGIMEQSRFIDAILTIAPPYGFDVIDMYNTNFLNSHDAKIKQQYITDGVHPNEAGYYMIAEHLASQIIQRCEQ